MTSEVNDKAYSWVLMAKESASILVVAQAEGRRNQINTALLSACEDSTKDPSLPSKGNVAVANRERHFDLSMSTMEKYKASAATSATSPAATVVHTSPAAACDGD